MKEQKQSQFESNAERREPPRTLISIVYHGHLRLKNIKDHGKCRSTMFRRQHYCADPKMKENCVYTEENDPVCHYPQRKRGGVETW